MGVGVGCYVGVDVWVGGEKGCFVCVCVLYEFHCTLPVLSLTSGRNSYEWIVDGLNTRLAVWLSDSGQTM